MYSAYSVQYQNVRKTWILIFFFVALVTSGFYFLGWFYDSYWLAIVGLGLSLGRLCQLFLEKTRSIYFSFGIKQKHNS